MSEVVTSKYSNMTVLKKNLSFFFRLVMLDANSLLSTIKYIFFQKRNKIFVINKYQ